jgi:hypothetical protein
MKRRGVIIGVGAVGGALVLGLYRFTDLFVKHYPPTPYDDLLNQLTDRKEAAKLGTKTVDSFDLKGGVARLRSKLDGKSLKDVVGGDLAAGRMVEVEGWVLPETLVWLSALAAKV